MYAKVKIVCHLIEIRRHVFQPIILEDDCLNQGFYMKNIYNSGQIKPYVEQLFLTLLTFLALKIAMISPTDDIAHSKPSKSTKKCSTRNL